MRPQIGLLALFTLLTTIVSDFGFPILPYSFLSSGEIQNFQVLAQTPPPDVLKARANQLLQLGIRQHKTGQFQAALESSQQALTIYREIDDPRGQANSLSNLGNTYFTLGEYSLAIESYQQQLEIVKALGDRPSQVKALLDMSNAYFHSGQDKLATELRRQAIVVKREIGNPTGEAAFYGDVGIAYDSQGQHKQAIEFYHEQLARTQKIGDRYGEAYALNHLGQVYQSQGKYPQAIEFYQQQLEVARKTGDTAGEIDALNYISATYESQGKYQEAIEVYQQQLSIAREKGDRTREANLLDALAAAYRRQGQYPQAIELYQQQLPRAQQSGDLLREGIVLNNLALTNFKSGNVTAAQQKLENAIQVWSAIRAKLGTKDNYFQEQATTYNLLQQVLIAQNQLLAALEISEQARFQGFVQLLGLRFFSEPAGTGLTPLPREITLTTIKQIQEIAREQNATIVEYSIIPDQGLYVWIIQPNGAISFRQVDLKSQEPTNPVSNIEDLVASYRKSIAGSGKSDIQAEVTDKIDPAVVKPLQQLHQLLIEPIETKLPKNPNARVIIIPQKELFLVPFAALIDTNGKYLIEKHPILTAPAIGALKLSRRARARVRGDKVLVVGNPNMPSVPPAPGKPPQPLPPLVGAEQEALEIAQLLKTKALTGNQATKAAIIPQLANARIIHFGTYGLLADQPTGVPGAIALAPGSDNGLLTAGEILSLPAKPDESPLHAELVVISAVETQQGRITADGLIGLSGSLIAGGVPRVIFPLWSVPDDLTASFMTQFYRNFQRNRDKAQALRQTMLTTLKQHPNPRDWAAFTFIGEAQ